MVKSQVKDISLDGNTLLTRKTVCEILHTALSSLDSLDTYKSLKRIKIGRHTFFFRDDVMNFILEHREGGMA